MFADNVDQQLDYGNAWAKLWSVVKTQKLFTAGIEHIGISYDDPKVTDPNNIRYDACLGIHKNAKPDGEVIATEFVVIQPFASVTVTI